MQFRSVISLLSSFQSIFKAEKDILTRDQMATMHRITSKYLDEYVSQSKKDINGGEYATLIDQLSYAFGQGFGKLYQERLIERLVQIFLKDHADLYYFSTLD